MIAILFLDFDGVTHPDPCRKDRFFCQLPLIEDALRDLPHVEVVVSSTWRFDHTLAELRSYFSPDLRPRVIGVTPTVTRADNEGWIPQHLLHYHREWECRKWMREHRVEDAPWLAIDDTPQWFLPDCSRLLVTQSKIGIQPHLALILREMMGSL